MPGYGANAGNFRSFGNTGVVAPGGAGINYGTGTSLTLNRYNNYGGSSIYRSYSSGYGHGSGYGSGWGSPYYRSHRRWINGYWGGLYPYGFGNGYGYGWGNPSGYGYGWGLGNGLGYGLGYGLGAGLSNWLYGSALYGYGYSPYSNPYAFAGTVPYDYSQPISTLSPPPASTVSADALAMFDVARAAFKLGNYETALLQATAALVKTPNDTALHEFRALCLFASGRYDEAASALYAVLSVGPGWDWTTLIGLYPNVDVYTAQLRALEAYCNANPQSAAGRFVLAYHYLAEGHPDAATNVLRQVVALRADDTLSVKLLQQWNATQPGQGGNPPPAQTLPDTTPMPAGATIFGTWRAQPAPDTSVVLTIGDGGAFSWQATRKGQVQQFAGTATFGGGILTLAQEKGPVLVGRIQWTDPSRMTFRVVGGGSNDPGLSFSR